MLPKKREKTYFGFERLKMCVGFEPVFCFALKRSGVLTECKDCFIWTLCHCHVSTSCHMQNTFEHANRKNRLTGWNRVNNYGYSSIMDLKLQGLCGWYSFMAITCNVHNVQEVCLKVIVQQSRCCCSCIQVKRDVKFQSSCISEKDCCVSKLCYSYVTFWAFRMFILNGN